MASTGQGPTIVNVSEGRFDYTADVYVDTSQKRGRELWMRPSGGTSNQAGPWHFDIPVTTGNEYLDLNKSTLEVNLRVVNADGTNMSFWEDMVAPVNMLGAVMWRDVDVTFYGEPMPSASAVHCGVKNYMENQLTYDNDGANTHLRTQLFYPDTPGQFNNFEVSARLVKENFVAAMKAGEIPPPQVLGVGFNPDLNDHDPEEYEAIFAAENITNRQVQALEDNSPAQKRLKREMAYQQYFRAQVGDVLALLKSTGRRKPNLGYEARMRTVRGSDTVNLVSPVPHDFFNLDNMISPSAPVHIKLARYSDRFLLNTYFGDKAYKIVIDDMILRYRVVERDGPVPNIEHYQMNQTELRTQIVEAGSHLAAFKLHMNGPMPKTIIVGQLDTRAFDGNYGYNPFFFDHFNAKRISLNVNGRQVPDRGGLEFDFTRVGRNPLMSRVYRWLFANTGALDADRGNLVGWDGFAHGSFLVPFDLTPDLCNGLHHHDIEVGYIDLNIDYAKPLINPIYIVYKMIFPMTITVNKQANRVTVNVVHAR